MMELLKSGKRLLALNLKMGRVGKGRDILCCKRRIVLVLCFVKLAGSYFKSLLDGFLK